MSGLNWCPLTRCIRSKQIWRLRGYEFWFNYIWLDLILSVLIKSDFIKFYGKYYTKWLYLDLLRSHSILTDLMNPVITACTEILGYNRMHFLRHKNDPFLFQINIFFCQKNIVLGKITTKFNIFILCFLIRKKRILICLI